MKNFLSYIFALLLLSSCSTTIPNQILNPALYGNNLKYLSKPIYKDSTTKSETFIAGNYFSIGPQGDDDAFGGAAEFSVSRGHSYKEFEFGYGGSFLTGKMNYQIFDNLGKNPKAETARFNALTLQASINGVLHYQKTEFRYLAFDLGYSNEFGNYNDIRNQLSGNRFYTVITQNEFFTGGLSSEIIWKDNFLNYGFKLGIKKNFGRVNVVTGASSTFNNSLGAYASFQARLKKAFIAVDVTDYSGRVGIGYVF
jgi:hypothetical protein